MWQQWYEQYAPQADRQAFLDATIAGLSGVTKTLPQRYLSNTRGAHAALQRAEQAILREHAAAIARLDAKVIVPCETFAELSAADAHTYLRDLRTRLGAKGGALVTVDLKKDPAAFLHAYNDGETSALNLGLLGRMNEALAADFKLDAFRHYAFYSPESSRVEMHLVSLIEQRVHVGGGGFSLAEAETIRTEVAHKYTETELSTLARCAGLALSESFVDARRSMAVSFLTPFRPSLLLAMDA